MVALQDALDDTDWDMFQRSSDDINVFMEAVVGFIGKLMDDTVQKKTVRTFPNQHLALVFTEIFNLSLNSQ